MRRADALITIGHRLKDEIVARGVPVDKITVVGNAISLTNRAESAWMFREPLRFGYVGNMSAFEGLFELLTAWSILEDSGARAQLHFHGTGKDETELRSLAHRLGLSTVTFHGRFEPSRATEVYETFDVVLNPRRSNRLSELVTPIKPLEAMYFGKLVMVSRVGGLLELISDGSTGIVIDGFEPQNIFEAVRNVLNMDRKKLEQIASKGQQWVVAERTWPNNAKPYIEMYARLLQSAR
jgi:glycosyltransferase involved in cell wall biosynthesis